VAPGETALPSERPTRDSGTIRADESRALILSRLGSLVGRRSARRVGERHFLGARIWPEEKEPR
jgi:hypothetical protein